MIGPEGLICDGCGQLAAPEHLAARFRRLEWATRFRPLHVNALLLGAVVPSVDSEFIYSDAVPYTGEAAQLVRVAGIDVAEKSAEAIHHEFQRAGLFVVHLLDCPVEGDANANGGLAQLLASRLPATFARIRRSIKPKRVVLVGAELDALVEKFKAEAIGCPLLLDGAAAFKLNDSDESIERLRSALAAPLAVAR
jgi:hypothetical protein